VHNLPVGTAGYALRANQPYLCSTRPRTAAILRKLRTPRGPGIEVVASDSFAEFLCEQLAPLGRISLRRMFGKTGVFCDRVMLGMVRDDTLYFRVDDHNQAAFEEARSFPPLDYEKQGSTIDLSFWRAPDRLFDEPDELVTWARAALAAARRVAAKRERKAPRRRPKGRAT
jgi:DNA transformation protein and related proteins